MGYCLSGNAAFAQWYRTYDDALRSFNAQDYQTAEAGLKAAKKEAESAGRKPGRSVLRYGSLREPFIPDYWLGQLYTRLSGAATDATIRSKYGQQAIDAFAVATSSGQVRERDPEYTVVKAAMEKAGAVAAGGRGDTGKPPVTDPLATAREEIKRLANSGNSFLASRSWDAALTAFQTAGRRLEAVPSLRTDSRTSH